MGKRFIAYLDILGFKDLVEKNSANRLVEIYKSVLENDLQKILKILFEIGNQFDDAKIEIKVISDSIIFWSDSDSFNGFATVVELANFLMYAFVRKGLPIRGAIVYDDVETLKINIKHEYFSLSSDIILGKGLVKAFQIEGQQNLVCCIIDESCIKRSNELTKAQLRIYPNEADTMLSLNKMTDIGIVIKYFVPFKNKLEGQPDIPKEQYVSNWSILIENPKPDLKFLYKSFMAHNKLINNPHVEKLIENTNKFVEYAWKHKPQKQ